MDRYDLYERAVTDGPRLARFLNAVHGGSPRVLAEHFSGSGALARAWPALGPRHRAIAIDFDAEPLAKLRGTARVTRERRDVMRSTTRADVIAAINFPIGYFHRRDELVAYLQRIRRLLLPGGVFVCDLYGGSDAFKPGRTRKTLRTDDGTRIDYIWEQRSADPLTCRVVDALHFHIHAKRRGGRTTALRKLVDAFVYDWRLWSLPELRDVAHEAGLGDMQVYNRLADASDSEGRVYVRPIEHGDELDDPWVVYIALRPTTVTRRATKRKAPRRGSPTAR
ncbi:MAG: class I SAM-dependent methyltransferase [Planctomycetota bacterium]|nr:class I SAM-dependent methyltransferase [Planctomycetota bacterium]